MSEFCKCCGNHRSDELYLCCDTGWAYLGYETTSVLMKEYIANGMINLQPGPKDIFDHHLLKPVDESDILISHLNETDIVFSDMNPVNVPCFVAAPMRLCARSLSNQNEFIDALSMDKAKVIASTDQMNQSNCIKELFEFNFNIPSRLALINCNGTVLPVQTAPSGHLVINNITYILDVKKHDGFGMQRKELEGWLRQIACSQFAFNNGEKHVLTLLDTSVVPFEISFFEVDEANKNASIVIWLEWLHRFGSFGWRGSISTSLLEYNDGRVSLKDILDARKSKGLKETSSKPRAIINSCPTALIKGCSSFAALESSSDEESSGVTADDDDDNNNKKEAEYVFC
jgi:hypothetical protein